MSDNPTNLDPLTAKYMSNGGGSNPPQLLQPDERVELTNNAPITTAATNSSPFGFATGDQLDDLLTTVIQIRAALISVGICKDSTTNTD